MSIQARLLLVDDELSARDSLEKWFLEEGYEVAATDNASDALTRLAEQRWDAALVDIKMRATDGIELPRRMREIDPELIVILMAESTSVETTVAALKNGPYDYVTKPLDRNQVAHRVNQALAHRRTEKENLLLRQTIAQLSRSSSSHVASKSLQEVERAHILRVVGECGGNQSQAAVLLDIDRVTLYHKLKKYGWSRTAAKSGSSKLTPQAPNLPASEKLTAEGTP